LARLLEREIDNRRREKREGLRNEQATDHRNA
jgi:hypothetical protein